MNRKLKKHLFKIKKNCDQFNTSFLNKSIHLFKKKIADPKLLNESAYPKLHICLLIIYTSNKIWISMGRNSTLVILCNL